MNVATMGAILVISCLLSLKVAPYLSSFTL